MNRAARTACTVGGNLGLLACGAVLLAWGLECGSWALLVLGGFFVACVARDVSRSSRRNATLPRRPGEEVSGRQSSAGPTQPTTRAADRSLHHAHK